MNEYNKFDSVIIRHIDNICLIEFSKSGWRNILIKVIETNFNEIKNFINKRYLKEQEKYTFKEYLLDNPNDISKFEKFFDKENVYNKIPPDGGGLNGFFKYLLKKEN